MKTLCELLGVFRFAVLGCGLFLLSVSSGCATTKIYRLNLNPTTATATLSAVADTAGDMGYQVTFLAAGVNVRYDHNTWIYYGMGEHDYSMVVMVDNDLAPEQRPARLEEAKAKAEEIWSRALVVRQEAQRPPGSPGATPSS